MLRKLSPLAILLSLIACSMFGLPPEVPQPPIEDLPDIQLFSSDDCLTSCWQGLRPGETDSAQVIQMLSNPPFTFRQMSASYGNATAIFTVVFAEHEDGYAVRAVIIDDRLRSVEITANRLDLTLGDIVDELGEPDYFRINVDIFSEIHFLFSELTVYYPNRGYAFHMLSSEVIEEPQEQEAIEICLSNRAHISGVTITPSGSINNMLENLDYGHREDTVTIEQLKQWSGFACFPMYDQ